MRRLVDWPGHAFVALPVRLYLAWVFIYACLHKIAHPGVFALDVATYDILPLALINPVALTLPYVELLAGVLLVVGWRSRGAALAVLGMMVVFIAALGVALAKGLDMSCGCFASQAVDHDPIGWATVLRDTAWLLMSLYVVLFDRHAIGLDRWLERRRSVHA